jgi:hypothetical protein
MRELGMVRPSLHDNLVVGAPRCPKLVVDAYDDTHTVPISCTIADLQFKAYTSSLRRIFKKLHEDMGNDYAIAKTYGINRLWIRRRRICKKQSAPSLATIVDNLTKLRLTLQEICPDEQCLRVTLMKTVIPILHTTRRDDLGEPVWNSSLGDHEFAIIDILDQRIRDTDSRVFTTPDLFDAWLQETLHCPSLFDGLNTSADASSYNSDNARRSLLIPLADWRHVAPQRYSPPYWTTKGRLWSDSKVVMEGIDTIYEAYCNARISGDSDLHHEVARRARCPNMPELERRFRNLGICWNDLEDVYRTEKNTDIALACLYEKSKTLHTYALQFKSGEGM